jgi:60S ribosome subunit biogenesis protein NIP7
VIRRPSREELTSIRRSFDRWGIFEIMKDRSFLINEDKFHKKKEVCMLSKASEKIVLDLQPNYVGLIIGNFKKKFKPSLAGADIIARYSKGFAYIIVDDHAEKLVLYGRDILGASIIEASKNLQQNQLIIILNRKREAIGVGQTKFSGSCLLKKQQITVSTLLDAGIYLRGQDD